MSGMSVTRNLESLRKNFLALLRSAHCLEADEVEFYSEFYEEFSEEDLVELTHCIELAESRVSYKKAVNS